MARVGKQQMRLTRFVLAMGALLMTTPVLPASPPLTGTWGGDRTMLTLEATAGRIEYDCGAGTIEAPLVLDAKGAFSTTGRHEDYTPGPTAADKATAFRVASYRGTVVGDHMTLRVQVAGEKAPRVLNLVRGQRVKLVRCL